MKKILIFCLSLCLFILAGCGSSKKVTPLTEESIKNYASEMKQDPLSGDITLNGVKYSLPIKAKKLEENGWKYNNYNDKGEPLKDGYYVSNIHMDDGMKGKDKFITVTLYNTSGSTINFDDAMLGAIDIKKTTDSYKNTVVLPKGITLKSTYDDIVKTYGPPDVNFLKKVGWISYTVDVTGKYGKKLRFEFKEDKKTIKLIHIKNIPMK